MKLKTLNDLKQWFISGKYYMVDKDDLKAEAVKWVKRLNVVALDQTQVTHWIKHFFNLTEEDLE